MHENGIHISFLAADGKIRPCAKVDIVNCSFIQ